MDSLDLHYPKVDEQKLEELAEARKTLLNEKGNGKKPKNKTR
jgi:hypothetical protein